MNIVFDIGGTNMRVAAAEGEVLGEIKKVLTPQEPKEGIRVLAAIARELAGDKTIEAMGGCISGSVDTEGVVYDARNLRRWEGVNIVRVLVDMFRVPVRIVNDAEGVGLGEAMHGAGKGMHSVGYITISTGVGGGHIVNGSIVGGSGVGHTRVGDSDLELTISGTAVEKRFGIHSKDLDSLDERNRLADLLAEGLTKIYNEWRPDVFVLGGSMIVGVNPIPLERVREKFTSVPVKMAELGDNGGLIGSAILATGT